MNRIIKLIAWMCLSACVFTCVGCEKKPEPQPILKVITGTQVGVTIFSYKRYYVVYDNGKTKRISEFEPTDSISYQFVSTNYDDPAKLLSGIDIDTEEGSHLNRIAENIILLSTESGNLSSPGAMYIVNEKIYFSTTMYKGDRGTVALFEYIESNNSIQKTATFKGGIDHVEAY